MDTPNGLIKDLTEDELDRLVDFLKTLTDESFKPAEPSRLPSGLAPVHNDEIALASGESNGEKNHE